MTHLLTVEDLAAELKLPVERTKRLARENDWPCIRFSRKSVRYSPDNVAAIVSMHAAKPKPRAAKTAGVPGQTAHSRARAS
jgi:hypothetical protein